MCVCVFVSKFILFTSFCFIAVFDKTVVVIKKLRFSRLKPSSRLLLLVCIFWTSYILLRFPVFAPFFQCLLPISYSLKVFWSFQHFLQTLNARIIFNHFKYKKKLFFSPNLSFWFLLAFQKRIKLKFFLHSCVCRLLSQSNELTRGTTELGQHFRL